MDVSGKLSPPDVAEVRAQLGASAEVLRKTAEDQSTVAVQIAELLIDTFKSGHKLLLCGNGGSAADAQHVATELLARYKTERRSLSALALGTDVTFLTAMSNDYDFSSVFSRQVEGLGHAGDVLWAFSTSGNSPNVIRATETARALGIKVVGFAGANPCKLAQVADFCLRVPCTDTPRIQETHMAVAHVICDLVERAFS